MEAPKMLALFCALLLLLQAASAFEEPVELDFPQPSGTTPPQQQQPTTPAASNWGDNNIAEHEAIASIEKAELFLQRAEAAHVDIAKCRQQINNAIASLGLVETYVLEDAYSRANTLLATAKTTVADCNKALESAKESSGGKAVLYLMKQALAQMQQASKPLAKLAGVPMGVDEQPTFQPATISDPLKPCLPPDGTTCQYSKCGEGKLLPSCVVGFAAGVVGGARGQSYLVTNSDDNPTSPSKGSLRYGVGLGGDDKGGVWITFAKSMTIVLKEMLWVRSYTTIDGRNANLTINGRAIVLAGVSNVILHNFQINSVGESDTVHIFAGARKVWVDHLTSFSAKLGLVSVVQGSTDVTISNCYLTNQNFNMLLGAADTDVQDQVMRVTVYRNWFKESMQRMPHCRWGYCHVINNLYTDWGYYAIGARAHGKIKSEANVFIPSRRTEVTPWFQGAGSDFDMTPVIQSTEDLLLNGSTFHQFLQFGPAITPQYRSTVFYPPKRPTSSLTLLVQRCAGALFGAAVSKCLTIA